MRWKYQWMAEKTSNHVISTAMKMCFLDLFQGSPHLNLGERVLTKYNGHFGKTNVLVGNKCLWIWQVQSLIYVLITKSLFHIQMNNFTTDLCLKSTFYFKWDIPILDLLLWLFYFFLFDIFISSLFQLYVKICTRQLNKTVLRMRQQNPRSRITVGMAR